MSDEDTSVEVELRLPDNVVMFYDAVSDVCGYERDVVCNVVLAMHVVQQNQQILMETEEVDDDES